MTKDQALLSGIAKSLFRLNGQLLAIGEDLAKPAGLTAARWQVLATVLARPLPVVDIAREIGVTRQSVQRISDVLVEEGLAEYSPNPLHRRAKLLRPTERGCAAIRRTRPGHAVLAGRVANKVGRRELRRILTDLIELSAALDELAIPERGRAAARLVR